MLLVIGVIDGSVAQRKVVALPIIIMVLSRDVENEENRENDLS